MVYQLVAIKDEKLGKFFPVRCSESVEAVSREFILLFKPSNNDMMSSFPEDYSLYSIGEFDTTDAHIILSPSPELIMSGFQAFEYWKGVGDNV